MSRGNIPDSSNGNFEVENVCRICGGEPICEGLGVIRYDVDINDPRFGKLFRCPNNPVEMDKDHQERLRRASNLNAYSDKNFYNFDINLNMLKPLESTTLQRAFEEATKFAEHPEGWLLLEGVYGCGKTHLAAAIGNERLRQGDIVLFITVPDLLDHLRATFSPSSETGYDDTFERIRNAPILILDDLGTENTSGWAREKLFQLFNHRHSFRLPTVVTTNVDLDNLDPRIRSRLLDQNIIHRVKIVAPDYRTSVQNQRDQLFSNLAVYKDKLFETFDTTKNATAEEKEELARVLRIATDYAQNPDGWLVLIGPYSSGKTHLAAAIANYWQQKGSEVMFVTVPDLLDYLRVTYNPQSNVSFDHRFQMVRNSPFLVLDNLGTENSSPWAKEKLFQIIDFRYVARLPTIITTALLLENIDERIRSRVIDQMRSTITGIRVRGYPTRLNPPGLKKRPQP